jgi:ssDNA-binding Zn-finger/Zn-ribbon topoisomerase 1
MPESHDLICPECGRPMRLKSTQKYTYSSGLPRKFYGCTGYPDCRGTHGAHPNGEPFGIPGDAETKAARMRAHAMFDRLWKPPAGTMKREQAYKLMQRLMQMNEEQAHIAKFSAEQCELLIKRLEGLRPRFAEPTSVGGQHA